MNRTYHCEMHGDWDQTRIVCPDCHKEARELLVESIEFIGDACETFEIIHMQNDFTYQRLKRLLAKIQDSVARRNATG